MNPSETSRAPLQSRGVHLIGDFVSKCGLSQSGRDVCEVIASMGIPVERLDLPLFPERAAEKKQLGKFPLDLPAPAAPVSLLNLNADGVSGLAAMLPRHFFENRYVIGIWYWETEVFPPHHQAGFDYVDEVWVTSRHVARILEKTSPVPIRQFTHLIHPPRPAGPETLPAFLQNDRFVFLFCFSFLSMGERKNPAAVCGAFVRAFPEARPDGPLCVIKSNGAYPDHALELLDLRRQYRHRPDIHFMDGWLTPEQRDGLMNRASCYVSLHRAEGLGLTILESMSLGKPCIGTAYSGNLDFMTPDNSWLIPCRMVPVGPRHYPFEADHLWAEPDPAAAAAALLEAYSDPALLAAKGRRARQDILARHSTAAVAETMRPLLEDAMARTPRVKPGLSGSGAASAASGRAQAYQILKQAKAAQKTADGKIKNLGGWRVAPAVRTTLQNLLQIQKLQQDAQSEILRHLGALKQQMRGYDLQAFERLLLDQRRTADLVRDLAENLWREEQIHAPKPPSGLPPFPDE